MGALEQVTQMRREGHSDEEIISALKKQGTSPKDINEALNHAQIKSAVADIQGDDMQAPYPQGDQYQSQQYDPQASYQDQNYANYPPQDQNQQYDQSQVYTPQPQAQEYYPQQQGYQQGYDSYSPQTNTDTIVEISEQVFDEKISEISKRTDANDEFKNLAQSRLEQLNDRLKRIEITIDKLQAAILDKIGSYGTNLDSIKKEMSMMQDTFSKTLNPLLDISQHKNPRSVQEEPERLSSPVGTTQGKEDKISKKKK